jgi:hypothetical protein
MAVTVLDTVNNQWFVQRKDGELEPCHNRATANLLCREYNKKEDERQKQAALIHATRVQLQQVSV